MVSKTSTRVPSARTWTILALGCLSALEAHAVGTSSSAPWATGVNNLFNDWKDFLGPVVALGGVIWGLLKWQFTDDTRGIFAVLKGAFAVIVIGAILTIPSFLGAGSLVI